jgi:HEAT repeat protein
MSHVFISYARHDGLTHAEKLESALAARRYPTWRDKRGIDPARDFTAEIERALKDASHVVACITPDVTRDTSFVRREIQYALLLDKPVHVARFDKATLPPIHIVNNTFIEFYKDWERGLTDLCAMLETAPASYRPPPLPPEADDPFRAYVGKVYQRAVDYLDRNIIRLIDLDVEQTPDAVPARQQDMFDLLVTDEATGADFHTFAEAFAHFNGRTLLLGEPGAGKTITLMAATRDAAAARLADRTAPLPIFGLLSVWDAANQTPLVEWLGKSDKLLTPEAVSRVMGNGGALLLLDGLDEMGSERTEKRPSPPAPLPQSAEDGGERGDGQEIEIRYDPRKRFLQTLKAQLGENRALVTCRITDYAAIGDQAALEGAVTLQKLTDAQLQVYLKDLPKLLEAVETDDALREIARTPLLLSYFAFAFRDRGDDLKALEDLREGALRDAIFNAYMDKRYAHEERRLKRLGQTPPFTLDEIRGVLGRVAMENAGGMTRRRGAKKIGDRHIDNVLERRDFELVLTRERVDPFINFCMWQQYLQTRTDGHYAFIHLLLRDTMVYEYSLPRLHDSELYTSSYQPNPAVALGAIKDRRAVEPLIRALADPNVRVYSRAAEALGQLGDLRAVEPLIQSLSDSDSDMGSSFAEALGQLGDPRAVEPLIRALADPGRRVPSVAAEALGQLGDPRAVEPLIRALADPVSDIRYSAAWALGCLGNSRAVEPLIRALADPDEDITSRVANALVRLGAPSVEPLIQALADPDSAIRSHAADALGQLSDPRAVKPLIRALADPVEIIGYRVSNALVKLGAPSVEPLIQALIDPNSTIRSHAATTLAQLDDPRAVGPLTTLLLSTEEGVYEYAAALALKHIGTPEAINAFEEWRARGGDKR